MDNDDRDRLLTETHTMVVDMRRQLDVLFKKSNGADVRFRQVDDRCAKRGEHISVLNTRVALLWAVFFLVFAGVVTALVKTFLG